MRGRKKLPVEKVKSTRVCVYITETEHVHFDDHAKRLGMTEAQLGRHALRKYLRPQKIVSKDGKEIVKADTSLYFSQGK